MRYFYNSCRNRHCPQCQGLKRAKWVDKLACDLLPVQYFHIVFTIPSEINSLALINPAIGYDILFKAATEALLTLSKDQKYLNSLTGIVAILHSWGQNLMYHPHLHTMVPAGGWNEQQQKWHASRKKFFIPVRVVSALFKGKFLFYLKKAYCDQELTFAGSIDQLKIRRNFNDLVTSLYQKNWVVFTKKPFRNSSQIINYIGRYSHRVAIANSRIKSIEGNQVTFSMKDYRDGKQKQSNYNPPSLSGGSCYMFFQRVFVRSGIMACLPHAIVTRFFLAVEKQWGSPKSCQGLPDLPGNNNFG